MTNGDAIFGIVIIGFIAVWACVIAYVCVRKFREGMRKSKMRAIGGKS